jgi:hypothetical protein
MRSQGYHPMDTGPCLHSDSHWCEDRLEDNRRVQWSWSLGSSGGAAIGMAAALLLLTFWQPSLGSRLCKRRAPMPT